ncbi:MAG: GCN5 family acetyltransferase [Herpetosiphonaceae bacterium]|nr:MAG: GCN5 family acetyltransferase [Herpetosiphonaceae bacterium]
MYNNADDPANKRKDTRRGHIIAHANGRPIRVRPITRADALLLVDLYDHLSPESRQRRFFKLPPQLPRDIILSEAQRLADIDPRTQVALLATIEEDGREHAIAVARLVCSTVDPRQAEVALIVRDDYQKQGLATRLCQLLSRLARARGISVLHADTLAENEAIFRLLHRLGVTFNVRVQQGEVRLEILLTPAAWT